MLGTVTRTADRLLDWNQYGFAFIYWMSISVVIGLLSATFCWFVGTNTVSALGFFAFWIAAFATAGFLIAGLQSFAWWRESR